MHSFIQQYLEYIMQIFHTFMNSEHSKKYLHKLWSIHVFILIMKKQEYELMCVILETLFVGTKPIIICTCCMCVCVLCVCDLCVCVCDLWCVCVCVICMCVCVCVCIYVYTHTCVRVFLCVWSFVHGWIVYLYMYPCVIIWTYMCSYLHVYMYELMCEYTYMSVVMELYAYAYDQYENISSSK